MRRGQFECHKDRALLLVANNAAPAQKQFSGNNKNGDNDWV
jgi:hypothetical protein